MKTKHDRIKETIKNLEGTIKKMGNVSVIESVCSIFQPTRAKKSVLKAKVKELKQKLNG